MSNGTQRVRRTLTLATALVAFAAPAASAMPETQILSENAGSTIIGNDREESYSSLNSIVPPQSESSAGSSQARGDQEEGYSSVTSIAPYSPQDVPSSTPVATSSDGFDWGDAGIGATAMLALTAMLVGGAVVLRTRPQRGSVA
jgi:hypothetical protein